MKILVVEDEALIANLIKTGLEMEEDCQVDLAFDGTSGLAKAISVVYDLIILDLMLPEIDGLEILKRLRKNSILTPIMMLTARDTANDRALAKEAGANDYIVKPFTFVELTQKIKSNFV